MKISFERIAVCPEIKFAYSMWPVERVRIGRHTDPELYLTYAAKILALSNSPFISPTSLSTRKTNLLMINKVTGRIFRRDDDGELSTMNLINYDMVSNHIFQNASDDNFFNWTGQIIGSVTDVKIRGPKYNPYFVLPYVQVYRFVDGRSKAVYLCLTVDVDNGRFMWRGDEFKCYNSKPMYDRVIDAISRISQNITVGDDQ